MTYQQIEAFMAIVEKGSITKAADALYITQPAPTHRIAELEKELDTELFVKKFILVNFQYLLSWSSQIIQKLIEKWIKDLSTMP